jgi:hypothetical protein
MEQGLRNPAASVVEARKGLEAITVNDRAAYQVAVRGRCRGGQVVVLGDLREYLLARGSGS